MKTFTSIKWSNAEKYLALITVFLLTSQMLLPGSLPVHLGYIAQPSTFLSNVHLGFTSFVKTHANHTSFTLAFFLLSPKTGDIIRQACVFSAFFLGMEFVALQEMMGMNPYILHTLVLLSVFFVAMENISARKLKIEQSRYVLLAIGGLLHGASLGNTLLHSGGSNAASFFSYASFSTGVLLAELAVLAALFVVVAKFLSTKDYYKRLIVTPVSLLLATYCTYEVIQLIIVPN